MLPRDAAPVDADPREGGRGMVRLTAMQRRRSGSRGFTLIEMGIVVAVVGILAVMAIMGYRKLTNSSHMAEASSMILKLREYEQTYHSETGHYIGASLALAANQSTNHAYLYPHLGKEPGNYKVAWGATCPTSACTAAAGTWTFATPDGPVFYGYTLVNGGGSAPTQVVRMGAANFAWPATVNDEWFIATAVGDPDGNGKFSTVMGTSFDNQIGVDMEGE
jgi:type IV pilus assembly protein PilA